MKRLIMLIAASAMLLSACSGKEKISFVKGEFNQMEFIHDAGALSGTLPEWKPNFKPGNGGGFGRGPRPEGGNGDKPMGGRPGERPLGPGAAAAHMGTFPVAYTFTPALEWLFGQVKRVPTANIITP